jgi:Helicase conserved C-terminal domain
MNVNVINRQLVLAALRRELVGPDAVLSGRRLNTQVTTVFKDFKDMRGPWVDQDTGAEIISQDTPTKRYGVGVLHPLPGDQVSSAGPTLSPATIVEAARADEDLLNQEDLPLETQTDQPDTVPDPGRSVAEQRKIEKLKERIDRRLASTDPEVVAADEFDVSGANGFRPSAIAVSFLADVSEGSVLRVKVPTVLPVGHVFAGMPVNGRYLPVQVQRLNRQPTQGVPGEPPAQVMTPPPEDQPIAVEGTAHSVPLLEAQTTAADAPVATDHEGAADSSASRFDTFWMRSPVELEFELAGKDLLGSQGSFLRPPAVTSVGTQGMALSLEVLARRMPGEASSHRLITVSLVNRSAVGHSRDDRYCLFQTYLEVGLERDGMPVPAILPYPKPMSNDPEEQSNALLYRLTPTFATGHGCAADWVSLTTERALQVRFECLPTYEAPSITPDITRVEQQDGKLVNVAIKVPMRGLAGLDATFDIGAALQEICDAYSEWIEHERSTVALLSTLEYQETAKVHLDACARALARMQAGCSYLRADADAMQAFQWANEAILLQQVRGDLPPRAARHNPLLNRVEFDGKYPAVSTVPKGNRGDWRAFQIAFLLLAVESAAKGEHPDREVVDLIWFPTGGGKTEAYLGLTAFSLFMRRLKNPEDAGTHVLMRYTLRLLTAQQFQRAVGLMCAMDYLRQRHVQRLGTTPFSGGIWVGGGTTPNRREDALKALKAIEGEKSDKNPFLVTRCPWCAAEMGPLEYAISGGSQTSSASASKARKGSKGNAKKDQSKGVLAVGYAQRDGTVELHCPDARCAFTRALPVYVIDEDIYEQRPSLIIGTVDKFAMLAWRPEARSIFGLGLDGHRDASPPGLVIQDELHLIAGPLGSMAGLFEGVVEALCTDDRGDEPVKPKLVCSTATIRSYRQQVKALYARPATELFPPPGLVVSDSFFARYAYTASGDLDRGRVYVGINGPGHGSMQTTQVRTFSALLQTPVAFGSKERDPWWTLLAFFNSLRELGTTVTLFQSDIPDYLRILKERYDLPFNQLRNPWNVTELTGRLDSEEVPRAIKDLEIRTDNPENKTPVDVVLASNIIEVGVDIGRLSVMAVVGQPKTTAQYIQVSGRVGRQWGERPGIVAMLYNSSKPRDRSHFEKFRNYHEQLYAQVEPTSVTPFSPPALERGLRAALVAFVRQLGEDSYNGPARTPKVYPQALADEFGRMLLQRVQLIDPDEYGRVETMLKKADAGWKAMDKDKYFISGGVGIDQPGLITPAGSHVNPAVRELTWMTPQSLRNVDATCEAKITRLPQIDSVRRSQQGGEK